MRVADFMTRLVRKADKKISTSVKHLSTNPIQCQAFGDFFVHEDPSSCVKPERPSKYTSYVVSESFRLEAEMIYMTKMVRSALWKLDLRLLPLMALLYFFSEMTRLSLNSIRFLGLQEDLGVDDSQFSLSLISTLIPLILVQLPSNLVLHRLGARIFFPCLITLLGLVNFFHGFLVNYAGLLAARFFSGLLQGGIFPGFLLYFSTLYTRAELQWRIGLVYSAGCLAGGFSPSLAYTITRLNGTLGLSGWTWFFIIEGCFTFFSGVLGYALFPASLEGAKFLTADEKEVLSQRLHRDRSPITAGVLLDAKPFRSMGFQILHAIRSPHVLLVCLALFFAGTNVTSLTYFQSNIIYSLGRTPSVTQILPIPPHILAFLTVLLSAYVSDKFEWRALTTVFWSGISAIGFSMLYVSEDSNLKFASFFLIVIGAYGVIPSLIVWLSNNSAPYARKAASISLGAISVSSGGLISILLFAHPSDSNHVTAIMVNVAFSMLVVISCLANLGYLSYIQAMKTHQRDEVLQHYAICDQTVDPSIQDLLYLNGWEYLGDRHPDFQYSL